jgi:hypothetical protein
MKFSQEQINFAREMKLKSTGYQRVYWTRRLSKMLDANKGLSRR